MEPEFDTEGVRARLQALDRWQVIAFGLALAERMLPEYTICSRRYGWPGRDALRSALDRAWLELGRGAEPVDLSALAKACEDSLPDSDIIDSGDEQRGVNAGDAMAFLMRALAGAAVESVAEMAALAHHNAELVAQDHHEDMNFQEPAYWRTIHAHPAVQTELGRQREDLELLAAWRSGFGAALPILATRWRGDDQRATGDGDAGEGDGDLAAWRAALLERAGGWLTLTEAASATRRTWQWVHYQHCRGRALALVHNGELVLPKLQFTDGEGEASGNSVILPGVGTVVRLFRIARADGWSALQFLVEVDATLGQAPFEVLRIREVDAVNAVEHAANAHLAVPKD